MITIEKLDVNKKNAFFKAIINNIQEGIIVYDTGLKYKAWNPFMEKMTGIPAENVLGRHPLELFPFLLEKGVINRIERALKGETPDVIDFPYTIPSTGYSGWASDGSSPLRNEEGKIIGVIATVRDITEQKKAEENYRTLFREMLDGFALHKIILNNEGHPVDYRFIAVNPAFERLTGLKGENIIGRTVLEIMPGTESHWIKTYGHVALTGEPAFFENYTRELDKYFQVTAFKTGHEEFACIFADITDRKRAENALRESEERYHFLADNSTDTIWTMKLDGTFIYHSPAVIKLRGYTPEEANSISLEQTLTNDSMCLIRNMFEEEMKKPPPERWKEKLVKLEMYRKDGTAIWTEVSFHGICDNNGNIYALQGSTRDITERIMAEDEKEKLQSQLIQAQKMESIGRLAGGVAHDFNNMLGVILGHAEMALEEIDSNDSIYRDIKEIEKAARRSADLTGQLLAFARKQTIAPRILDINDTISSMLRMIQRLIGENIELMWMPGQNLWKVRMDPSQFDQILTNLCINAKDSISGSGRISIETKNISVDDTYCDSHRGFISGNYVMVTLSDDGCGMSKDVMEHVFEPFFTTKELGKGTGLGLAMVYGIIRQNNGFINVYSEEGMGTTFRIYIPQFIEKIQEKKHSTTLEDKQISGETILLVEDEPMILEIGEAMLKKLGYNVLSASTPESAIKIASEFNEKINLLITDVVMPKINGKELFAKIQSFYNNIKCLFMSGYTADVIASHGILDKDVIFIQKPFTKKELQDGVRKALE